MNKIETGKIENAKTARVLRDDEVEFVSGGWSWGISQSGGLVAPSPRSIEDLLISH